MDKLEVILKAINKTRGEDIKIYDFVSLNPFIDKVVITSASNLRQVYAISTNIKDALKENKYDIKSIEGKADSKWILIDCDDIVVHVFLNEEREFYHLDRLYADLPRLDIE